MQHNQGAQKNLKKWNDPVKGRPAHRETLEIEGDFEEFKNLMRRAVRKREDEANPPASRAPDASS
jgi:hypothetical protein